MLVRQTLATEEAWHALLHLFKVRGVRQGPERPLFICVGSTGIVIRKTEELQMINHQLVASSSVRKMLVEGYAGT